MEQKEEKQGRQKTPEIQESETTLQKSYADVLLKMERYISLSSLSEGEKKRCLKKISMKLLAAQIQGAPYRSVTGGNLQTFCDQIMQWYRKHTGLIQKGIMLVQMQCMAVSMAVLVAAIQSVAVPRTGLWEQRISIFLVYGMAALEQMIQAVLHWFLKRQVIHGNDKWYSHLEQAEWGVRLVCYVVYGSILYLTPLYRQVTTLPFVCRSLAGILVLWGICVIIQRYETVCNPAVVKLPVFGQIPTWVRLVLELLLAACAVWLQFFYLKHQAGWGIWFGLLCVTCVTVFMAEWYERSRKHKPADGGSDAL